MTAVRRSQPQRTEQMRARLLDATIECLADLGYGGMSTNDVVRRAGVSRGALAHHFPTRSDLVRTAAEQLVERRAVEFRRQFESIPASERTPSAALDVLWSFYDSRGATALLELTVAARHRPELESLLAPMVDRIGELTVEVFAEYFPDLASLPHADQALRAIHALFAGLSLGESAGADTRAHSAELRALLAGALELPLTRIVPMLSMVASTFGGRS